MKQNGIWLKKGFVPYHLNASELALALLAREKPLSAQQLSAALTEKASGWTANSWEKFWPNWNVPER